MNVFRLSPVWVVFVQHVNGSNQRANRRPRNSAGIDRRRWRICVCRNFDAVRRSNVQERLPADKWNGP